MCKLVYISGDHCRLNWLKIMYCLTQSYLYCLLAVVIAQQMSGAAMYELVSLCIKHDPARAMLLHELCYSNDCLQWHIQ